MKAVELQLQQSTQQIRHLMLRSIEPLRPSAASPGVVILGNAYGVMPYQEPLATAIAARGFKPWWFAFSGQAGTPGTFEMESVMDDLSIALDHIRRQQPGSSLFVISHCMGGLLALEYIRRNDAEQSLLKGVIVYGLLFNPARRWRPAIARLKKTDVNFGFTREDAAYDPLRVLPSVRIPLLFCHAKDRVNLRRATESEIQLLAETAPNAQVSWFDEGYDRKLEPLSSFVECYCSWIGSILKKGE